MIKFIYSILLFGVILSAQAQPNSEARLERIRAFRVAVFTDVLRLTPEEAQGFWPIYNEYLENREKTLEALRPQKQVDAMSDSEVEEAIKRHFEMRQREIELEKELYQKLRRVLPARKIARIPSAERAFRERLVERLQNARERRREHLERRN
ncbi:MAG: hypothetical protein NZM43_03215 [Saprospiraceae bacterium]|nr:hypothetical protein [Saprospiraceae bacterium]MDW8483313.1 hypothetical protein [Saprospiraceae bacterium]